MTDALSEQELIYFNGLRPDGRYFTPPMSPAQLTLALTEPDRALAAEIEGADSYAVSRRVKDPMDLSQTGWGVIFPGAADEAHVAAVMDGLDELLKWREGQAGPGGDHYFRIFKGGFGYQPEDTRRTFLKRLGLGASDLVDPRQGVPYYLLLVGGPEEIPFRFGFELDVQFAVGRIDFGRDYEAYANYARNVVSVESGQFRRDRKAVFFGVAHDEATRLSARHLINPLYQNMFDYFSGPDSDPAWTVHNVPGPRTTRARLEGLLGGDETPALLFTASHGLAFDPGHPDQTRHQGALICQDWRRGPIQEKHYFAGDHIGEGANLLGQIAFCFACFGAGTPRENQFLKMDRHLHEIDPDRNPEAGPEIARIPFTAALPKRMLGMPNGALAFIGHVDRAWGYSFGGRGQDVSTLDSILVGLLMGDRVGWATDAMNLKYATLATEVTSELHEIERLGEKGTQEVEAYIKEKETKLVGLWTDHNDARNYVVLGDPAVHLMVQGNET